MNSTNTATIMASDLVSGMSLKRGFYDSFNRVTSVTVGITHTTYDLDDGSRYDVRNQTTVEVVR